MAKASDPVARARRVLHDYDADVFTDEDILTHVNGARRALAIAKPDVYSDVIQHTLIAGVRQPVPVDCSKFYELQMNLDATGKPTTPISVIQREELDVLVPGWRSALAGPTQHFMYDERTPGYFLVSPPAVAGAKVELSESKIPVNLDLEDDLNAQESLLQDTLADYALARLLLEDAEAPANAQRGVMHLSLFASATGSDLKALLRTSPNYANEAGAQNKG